MLSVSLSDLTAVMTPAWIVNLPIDRRRRETDGIENSASPRFPSGFRSSLAAKLALAVFVFVGTMGAVRVLSLGRLALVDVTSTEVRNH